MPEPNKIPKPFAASGDKNTIPESTETIGLASWNEGFPAITSTPFAEGGVAPKRADFNGIFNALSLAALWQQQGGFYAYDNSTDYEVGNVVEYSGDLYKCLVANGPGSAVKAPTDTTVWSKVMTAADAAALYLPLAGGTLTGTTNAPTPTTTDNSTKIATTAFVNGYYDKYIKLGIPKFIQPLNGESVTFHMRSNLAIVFIMRGSGSKIMIFDTWSSAPTVYSQGTLDVTGSFSGGNVTITNNNGNAVVVCAMTCVNNISGNWDW